MQVNEILLHRRGNQRNEYYCSITDLLDAVLGLSKLHKMHGCSHYILYDCLPSERNAAAIRIPGRSVGSIHMADDNTIEHIDIFNVPNHCSYPEDVIEKLNNMYAGAKMRIIDKHNKTEVNYDNK